MPRCATPLRRCRLQSCVTDRGSLRGVSPKLTSGTILPLVPDWNGARWTGAPRELERVSSRAGITPRDRSVQARGGGTVGANSSERGASAGVGNARGPSVRGEVARRAAPATATRHPPTMPQQLAGTEWSQPEPWRGAGARGGGPCGEPWCWWVAIALLVGERSAPCPSHAVHARTVVSRAKSASTTTATTRRSA